MRARKWSHYNFGASCEQELILADWNARESIAEAMIPLVGRLYRERNVEISIYGRVIVKRSVIDVIKAHRFVRQVEDEELSVIDTFPVLEVISGLDLHNAHVDIAKLAVKFRTEAKGRSLEQFVADEMVDAVGPIDDRKPVDVVLYGFGRIGRILARQLVDRAGIGHSMRLRAVVVRKGNADNDLEKTRQPVAP